jgi:hypothetical protein
VTSRRGVLEAAFFGLGEKREYSSRGAVSRNKDLIGCVMARGPEEPPVPPRERLLGLRLPHGPL